MTFGRQPELNLRPSDSQSPGGGLSYYSVHEYSRSFQYPSPVDTHMEGSFTINVIAILQFVCNIVAVEAVLVVLIQVLTGVLTLILVLLKVHVDCFNISLLGHIK